MEQLTARAQPGDALVFVGDYIDRGPDSRGVLDQVLALRAGGWNGPVTPLRGNHEAMMLDFISDDPQLDPEVWIRNGGLETIASYTGRGWTWDWQSELPEEHLELLHSLPLWHEDENGIYVHAGFYPGCDPAAASEEECLWIREAFLDSDYAWPKVVVFGHTPQYDRSGPAPADLSQMPWRPLVRPEKIGIDTGAAYGGPLSAVILPDRELELVAPGSKSGD